MTNWRLQRYSTGDSLYLIDIIYISEEGDSIFLSRLLIHGSILNELGCPLLSDNILYHVCPP